LLGDRKFDSRKFEQRHTVFYAIERVTALVRLENTGVVAVDGLAKTVCRW